MHLSGEKVKPLNFKNTLVIQKQISIIAKLLDLTIKATNH